MTRGIFKLIGAYEIIYFLAYMVLMTMHLVSREAACVFVTASVLSLILITFNHVKNEKSGTAAAVIQYSTTLAILVLALTKTGI